MQIQWDKKSRAGPCLIDYYCAADWDREENSTTAMGAESPFLGCASFTTRV